MEIGCGLGVLLDEFRKDGWDVLGVEPNRGYCQIIETDLGIRAIPSTLKAAALPDASVDVVVMLHVIEHVPDPLGILQEIFRVLKPGGHLIMETPRYDTSMFTLLGKRERSLNCPGYIYFWLIRDSGVVIPIRSFPGSTRHPGRIMATDRPGPP